MASQPDTSRMYDVVVFGATGFTGKKVLAELLVSKPPGLRVAAAGRSEGVLTALVCELKAESSCGVISGADVASYESILTMAKQGRLLINCVGPYRLYGETVVKACVHARTNYVDLCGEPEFIERMEFTYGQQAAQAGIYMASACGFDSLPADWGTVMVQSRFKAPEVPSSVEAYITIKPGSAGYRVHYATWHCAVMGLGAVASLRALRAQVRAAGNVTEAKPAGPKPKAAPAAAYCSHEAVRSWHLPFPGADASVVRRSQAALAKAGEPPVHFVARFTVASRFYGYVGMAVGGLMSLLAKHTWGRALLLSKPTLFSYGVITHEGPSEEQMRTTKTVSTLIGRGYTTGAAASAATGAPPDKEVVLQIVSSDPGYNATSIFIVQAALAILEEPHNLPSPGIHTPGVLLRRTAYQDRLQSRGVEVKWL